MKDLKVWMRVGDQDDYHSFDSPEEAASELSQYLVIGKGSYTVERHESGMLRGINLLGTELVGCNAVSLFWGDDDAQYALDLSNPELEAFTRTLESETGS